MNKAEATARNIARDAERARAYEAAREASGKGYVLIPDADLVLAATLVRRAYYVGDLGATAREDRDALLDRLVEAMDLFQTASYVALAGLDETALTEWREADR